MILGLGFFFIIVAALFLYLLHNLQVDTNRQTRAEPTTMQRMVDRIQGNEATNVNQAAMPLEEQRRLVERNRQMVAQGVFLGSWVLLLLSLAFVAVYMYFIIKYYFFGWWVWADTKDKPCDAPLSTWLLLVLISAFFRVLSGGEANPAAALVWLVFDAGLFVMGIIWINSATTCRTSNPELYWFDHDFLVFIIVRSVVAVVVIFISVSILVFAIENGWLEGTANAATPDVIEKIPVVDAAAAKAAGAAECCICCNAFDDTEEIKMTGCNHCFHTECLGKWLKNARTCPLCRLDLQETIDAQQAAAGDGVPKASA